MGTEISIWVEVCHERGWVYAMSPDVTYGGRNRDVYRLLAGYEGATEGVISPPRELPEDMAQATQDAVYGNWRADASSWVTLKEVVEFNWTPELRAKCADFLAWVDALRSGPTSMKHIEPERIRLIIGFED